MTAAQDDWNALARETVDAVWTGAKARFEELGVTRDELLAATVSRTLARFATAGRDPGEVDFRRAIERAALDDLGLALAWERGSGRAWELYETEFKDAVITSARRQGATPSAADELADELPGALLAASAAGGASPLARYDGSGSLRGWLRTIARRRVADAAQRDSRRQELEEERLPIDHARPEASAEGSELAERLRRSAAALRASLTPRERLVLLLKHEQGLSQRTIARQLGVSDSRVTRLVQNATEKLREHLVRELGESLPADAGLIDELIQGLGTTEDRRTTESS